MDRERMSLASEPTPTVSSYKRIKALSRQCIIGIGWVALAFGAWRVSSGSLDAAAPAYDGSMSVKDYLTDEKSLKNKSVLVRGALACLDGNTCLLYATPSDTMTAIFLDVSGLARGERRRVLDCHLFPDNCVVTVDGRSTGSPMSQIKLNNMRW